MGWFKTFSSGLSQSLLYVCALISPQFVIKDKTWQNSLPNVINAPTLSGDSILKRHTLSGNSIMKKKHTLIEDSAGCLKNKTHFIAEPNYNLTTWQIVIDSKWCMWYCDNIILKMYTLNGESFLGKKHSLIGDSKNDTFNGDRFFAKRYLYWGQFFIKAYP